MHCKKFVKPWFISLILLPIWHSPASAKIYRWVDENGQVQFSDRVPPEASKLERHVLDPQGNLRDVLSRQRTVDELRQHRERLQAMQTEQARREQQQRYDQYLWSTFESDAAIKALRDERLAERQAQIKQAQAQRAQIQQALRKQSDQKQGSALAQQNLLRALRNDLENIDTKLQQLETLRQSEFQGLNQDLQRYEYLRVQKAIEKGR